MAIWELCRLLGVMKGGRKWVGVGNPCQGAEGWERWLDCVYTRLDPAKAKGERKRR